MCQRHCGGLHRHRGPRKVCKPPLPPTPARPRRPGTVGFGGEPATGVPFSRDPTPPLLPSATCVQLGASAGTGGPLRVRAVHASPGQARLKESASFQQSPNLSFSLPFFFRPTLRLGPPRAGLPIPCLATLWVLRDGAVTSLGTIFHPGPGSGPSPQRLLCPGGISGDAASPGSDVSGRNRRRSQSHGL